MPASTFAQPESQIALFADRLIISSLRDLDPQAAIRASVYFFEDMTPRSIELVGAPEVTSMNITLRFRRRLPAPPSGSRAQRYYVHLTGIRYLGASQDAAAFDAAADYAPDRIDVSRLNEADPRRDHLKVVFPNRHPDELDWLRRLLVDQVDVRYRVDQSWQPVAVEHLEVLPEGGRTGKLRGLVLRLEKALPRGKQFAVQASVEPPSGAVLRSEARMMTFEIPSSSDRSQVAAQFSFLSARRRATGRYDSEFLLDLLVAPRLADWAPSDKAYYLEFVPRLSASLGSERSAFPDAVAASAAFEFGHWLGGPTLDEYVSTFDARWESDRDFDNQNVVAGFQTELFFRGLVKNAEYQKLRRTPWRFLRIVPLFGYEIGGNTERNSSRTGFRTVISRFKAGLDASAGIGRWAFSVRDSYWLLTNEPARRHRNYLEASLRLQLGVFWDSAHGLIWKYRNGELPPFSSKADSFSVSYEFKY